MSEIVWKDVSTYSKSEVDRTPRTWEAKILDLRICITRKWFGADYGGWSKAWYVDCGGLVKFEIEDDIETVKIVALLRLKQIALAIVNALDV